MEFDEHQQVDTSQIDDRRSSGGGGFGGASGPFGSSSGGFPIPMGKAGGGAGILIAVVVLLFKMFAGGGGGLSINPSALGNNTSNISSGSGVSSDLAQTCAADTNWSDKQECRAVADVNSVQAYWASVFPKVTGQAYEKATTVFFRGQTNTGCGAASTDVGPFYCPADQHVYIDLDFYQELQDKFGAKGGPFAEAYVLAHEYGHHVQDLLGTSAKVERAGNQTGPTSPSVRLELQADCYAGVWAENATSGPRPLIKNLTEDDIREGLDAASAVGDDRIQKAMQGRVNPESWTHGSSEQRQRWFLVGYNSGQPAQCDTFNATSL